MQKYFLNYLTDEEKGLIFFLFWSWKKMKYKKYIKKYNKNTNKNYAKR